MTRRRLIARTRLTVRLALVGGLIGATFVTVAEPAAAKGILRARVTEGPGIDAPIVIDPRTRHELAQVSGVYEIAYNRGGVSPIARPVGDLGPRYEVEFRMGLPGGPMPIRQRVFPFAGGGPVVHTPGGQPLEELDPDHPERPCSVCKHTADTWHRAAPELREAFSALDLPEPRTTLVAARVPAIEADRGRTVTGDDHRIKLMVPERWNVSTSTMLPVQIDPVMPLAVGTAAIDPQPVGECGIVPQRALEAVDPTDVFVGIYVTAGLASWGATVPERPKTFAAALPWRMGPMKCTGNVTALLHTIAFEEHGVKLTLAVATGAQVSDERRAELVAVLDSLRVSDR